MIPFLRYASFHKWNTSRNKDDFVKQFVYEEKSFGKGMVLGSEISRLLQYEPTNELVRDIPRYAIPEFPLITTIKGVPCVSHPDSFCPFNLDFYEYKTAIEKYKWTKAKVLRHEQLVFYATLIRSMFGRVGNCNLIEIRTEHIEEHSKNGALSTHIDEYIRSIDEITGTYISPIKHDDITFSGESMDKMELKIRKTWDDIEEYLKKNNL